MKLNKKFFALSFILLFAGIFSSFARVELTGVAGIGFAQLPKVLGGDDLIYWNDSIGLSVQYDFELSQKNSLAAGLSIEYNTICFPVILGAHVSYLRCLSKDLDKKTLLYIEPKLHLSPALTYSSYNFIAPYAKLDLFFTSKPKANGWLFSSGPSVFVYGDFDSAANPVKFGITAALNAGYRF